MTLTEAGGIYIYNSSRAHYANFVFSLYLSIRSDFLPLVDFPLAFNHIFNSATVIPSTFTSMTPHVK